MMNLVCVMLGLLCVEIFAVLCVEIVSLRKKVNKLESMYNTTEDLSIDNNAELDDEEEYYDYNYINDKPAIVIPEGFEITHVEYVRDSEGNWTTKDVQFKRRH